MTYRHDHAHTSHLLFHINMSQLGEVSTNSGIYFLCKKISEVHCEQGRESWQGLRGCRILCRKLRENGIH